MKKFFIFTLLFSTFLSACTWSSSPVSSSEASSALDSNRIENEPVKVEENKVDRGYTFNFPKGWQEKSAEGKEEGATFLIYDPVSQDKVEIQTLVDADHPEASVESRQEYLQRVIQRGDKKMELKSGEAYYFLNETAEGNFPSAHLFSTKNVFLVSFNSSLSSSVAEEWFKDFIATFQLTR